MLGEQLLALRLALSEMEVAVKVRFWGRYALEVNQGRSVGVVSKEREDSAFVYPFALLPEPVED